MNAEVDRIEESLAGPGGRWFEGLAGPLVRAKWEAVSRETGLGPASYGTMRHALRDASEAREIVTAFELPAAFGAGRRLVVETLRGDVLARYADLGLDFHRDGGLDAGLVEARLRAALSRIADVPALAVAVGAVLSVLHVVRPEGPDYDVGYSDPALPFSIFVGVGAEGATHGDLRLAEGILHECMHLQLTLIEEILPMVATHDERMHSPWQGTMRPTQGVLHGLYVFRVIQDFHRTLLAAGHARSGEEAYLRRRIASIEDESRSIGALERSGDLTKPGRRLAARLLT